MQVRSSGLLLLLAALAVSGFGCIENADPIEDGALEDPEDLETIEEGLTDGPKVYYRATLEDGATIGAPQKCNSTIGNGGNLFEDGRSLRGKCDGAGVSPAILLDQPTGSRFLKFAVDPARSVATIRDRAELALTSQYFPFNQVVYMTFKLMIPEGVSKTDEFFYPLQLWQCAGFAPIAGIRVTRGTSHTINFMTRSISNEASRASYQLTPGRWHRFILTFLANPDGPGYLRVVADGTLLVESRVPYGFSTSAGACAAEQQGFRIKFGIYKGGEPNRAFSINYDDVVIANRYRFVSP